jgi:hypothetical protein
MRPATWLSVFALTSAACNVYDQSLLDGQLNRGGAAGAATLGTGGSAGDAGHGGDAPGSGGASGAGGAGGTSGGGGSGGSAGASGAPGSGGSASGTGGANGSGGRAITDAAAEGSRDALPDISTPRDASGDVVDASSGPRDAVADIVTPNPDAPPCAGTALSLDGSSYAQIPRPVQDDFTMEAWIKTTASLTGTYAWEGRGLFFADASGGNNDFCASILNNRFAFGVGNPNNADLVISSISMVTTNQWTHVAIPRARATGALQVLVNGVVEASMDPSPQLNSLTAATNLAIGGNAGAGHDFSGLIDEVRVWNIVRPVADIAATMRQRLVGNEAGLVGYWRFDDADAALAVDSSTRNVTATLIGAPSWVPSDALCSP